MYNSKFGHLLNKKQHCERCNFTAEDSCQLDVVYIDGDKKNKNRHNMKTYCANCSRLHSKTLKETKKSIFDITIDADVRI